MNIVSALQKKKSGDQYKINFDHGGTQGVVFVGLDGWHKDANENREGHKVSWGTGIAGRTTGKQIRFAINGPLRMTTGDWEALNNAIDDAYLDLQVRARNA